mmetsp:Transcript_92559/g.267251  ORF Transcript_92559/g.267251 Transcript_92559/m.267251 type:complete len:229 (+) Transcript_92559:400-1086(+)
MRMMTTATTKMTMRTNSTLPLPGQPKMMILARSQRRGRNPKRPSESRPLVRSRTIRTMRTTQILLARRMEMPCRLPTRPKALQRTPRMTKRRNQWRNQNLRLASPPMHWRMILRTMKRSNSPTTLKLPLRHPRAMTMLWIHPRSQNRLLASRSMLSKTTIRTMKKWNSTTPAIPPRTPRPQPVESPKSCWTTIRMTMKKKTLLKMPRSNHLLRKPLMSQRSLRKKMIP